MAILNLWINWQNLFPNLSLTVQNNIGSYHEKIQFNGLDILFTQISRMFLNEFIKGNLIPLGIQHMPRNIWP